MTFVYTLVLLGIIAYSGICGFLYVKQRNLLYFPTPQVEITNTKHIVLQNEGHRIKTWVLNEGKRPAIIYFGGNAEGVEVNIASFQRMFTNYTIYILNYRGYGGSSGEPSENALFSDALQIYEKVKGDHSSISVIGRSLGSGVATYLAANRAVERLVLITPYDSVANVAQQAYPLIPISLLLNDRFESAKNASSISADTLIIIAEQDELIPRKNSDALAAEFSPKKLSVVVIAGQDHNSLASDSEYERTLQAFFGK